MFTKNYSIAALAVIVALGFSVLTLSTSFTSSSTGSDNLVSQESSDATTLAGRYHQRTRTQRFFDRSKDYSFDLQVSNTENTLLAGRYHQRTRTQRFFDRSGGYSFDTQTANVENDQLAARYHQRTRTKRFFGRSRGRGVA